MNIHVLLIYFSTIFQTVSKFPSLFYYPVKRRVHSSSPEISGPYFHSDTDLYIFWDTSSSPRNRIIWVTKMSSSGHVPETLLNVVEKLMSNGLNHLQVKEKYILPPHERPNLSEVCHSCAIPVVDLKDLDGPDRKNVVKVIRNACEAYGFFQIVNHGVEESVMKGMKDTAKEFFEMPVEDRAILYSEDLSQAVRLSTSFNFTKEKVLNWYDSFRHPCHPLEEVIDSWPEKPAAYRECAGKYAKQIRSLILRLLAAISEALGLDADYLNTTFGNHGQVLVINYYPPCPNPDLTFGVPPHSDPGIITVLMQGDVSGLQVLVDGKWVAVEPIPNAFVVNLGDQLQVVSNGRFKSAEHRAVTNMSCVRMSIVTFSLPSMDAFVAPAESMVDEKHPAVYKGHSFAEFRKEFFSQGLKSKRVLDRFQIKTDQSNSV